MKVFDWARPILSCLGSSSRCKALLCCIVVLPCSSLAYSPQQAPTAPKISNADPNRQEITTRDVTTTFKVKVNLVTVHAVARRVLEAVMNNLIQCMGMSKDRNRLRMVEELARAAAGSESEAGGMETRMALAALKDIANRMAASPGDRIILLASPGFLVADHHPDEVEVIDRAIRAGVDRLLLC